MTTRVCILSLATVLAPAAMMMMISAPAYAQEPADQRQTPQAQVPQENQVAAEALFGAGRADVERGDYASACPKFAESQKLDPAVGTLINLADCEEHIAHLAHSWQLWREALERLGEGDSRRPTVAARTAAIDKRVPRLTVKLARIVGAREDSAPPSIKRDDVDLPQTLLDVPLPLDPGQHTIVLSVAGHFPSRYIVTLAEGARETVTLEPGTPDGSSSSRQAAALHPPRPSGEDPNRGDGAAASDTPWLGYGLLGIGVVALGVGSTTGLLAIGKKNEQDDNCFPAKVCNEAGSDAAKAGSTLAVVSTVSFIAGGVSVLAGGYLVFRHRGQQRQQTQQQLQRHEPHRTSFSGTTTTILHPIFFANGAGIGMTRPL